MTVDVLAAAGVAVSWSVDLDTSDGPVTLGPWSETIPAGAWVTVWQEYRTPPGTLGGSPAFTATGPVQVRAPRASLVTDQTVVRQVVAGDRGGARVVLAGDALTAYDQTGTETARIAGEGGEFVGGSFRTSNTLPGQVVLSDTANQGTPGISIEPEDDTGYDVLPSIGPGPDDMRISGGVSTAGDIAGAQFRAGGTSLYWNGPGATGGGAWASVADGEAGLRYRPDRTDAAYESAIRARPDDAVVYSEGPNGTGFLSASPLGGLVQYVGPGDPTARSESRAEADPEYLMLERKLPGVNDRHRLVLDDDGVWVQTVFGPNPVSYNLLETAQDSGWQPITLESGITGNSSPAWRNKNGVIYFRGVVTRSSNWGSGGWTAIATDVGIGATPAANMLRAGASSATSGMILQVTAGGRLEVYMPSGTWSGGTTVQLSPMFYPLG